MKYTLNVFEFLEVYSTTLEIQKESLLFVYFICLHKYFTVNLAVSEFDPMLAIKISDEWIIGERD